MAGETVITVIGNLTADPELRFTQAGLPVVNFTIASTPRTFDRTTNDWKDGEALFLRASAWRELAEHIAGSLTKGMRVIAQGRLVQKSYQDREGKDRTSIELEVDEIGPSLKYATAQVTRATSQSGGGQRAQAQQSYAPQQGAPQQGAPAGYGPPQGQQPPQGYPAPGQQAPVQQQPMQQPPQGYPAPAQGQPPMQGQPVQQQPQPGTQQAAQQGQWTQPGAFGDDTPF